MNAEQIILLSQKLVMLSLANDNNEKKRLENEIALLNSELSDSAGEMPKTVYCRPLKFTDKEISKMPKTFRKEFRIDGCTAHVRKRSDARYRCSYEIRYRRNGYNITASARTLEAAKENFIQKLRNADNKKENPTTNKVPTTFNEFAYFWFENYHKRKVIIDTYKNSLGVFKRHIAQRFVNEPIKNINAKDIQDILDEYTVQGKYKTVEDIFGLFNQILTYAVKYGLIVHNPAEIVFYKRHERKHGKALSLDEEKKLLAESAGTHYQLMFAVALYTGLRPNEFKTVEIRGNMIIAKNSKRRNGEIAYKRIPILKMLKPYLDGVDKIKWVKLDRIRNKFREILPNHKLYDLRTTFYTHCQICGIAESARDEMVGHSGGILKDTYTDLPDEFLLKEAEKMVW